MTNLVCMVNILKKTAFIVPEEEKIVHISKETLHGIEAKNMSKKSIRKTILHKRG